jgi:hypothetical protein
MLVPGGDFAKKVLQSAAVATGNGTVVYPTSISDGAYTCLTLQVEGITTATITWEATIDGTNWVAIEATNLASSATPATTATADGIYRVVVAGLMQFRARISAWTTGATTVTGVMTA